MNKIHFDKDRSWLLYLNKWPTSDFIELANNNSNNNDFEIINNFKRI